MTSDGAHDPIRWTGTVAFEEGTGEERWTAQRSVEVIWDRLAEETLTDNATVVVTHYQRLLNYIVPDYVHVLADGRIAKSGDKELALRLEAEGYDWVRAEAA